MIFVTSWDDGHPLDERVAETLAKYRVHGTFYVPIRNVEGRPVMSSDALRQLHAAGFEIGAHTFDHVRLTNLTASAISRQINESKDSVEQTLGCTIRGFCYPGGNVNARVVDAVKQAGFGYARTVENLRVDPGIDAFRLPTTLQLFPHSERVLLRNFIQKGGHRKRLRPLLLALRAKRWWLRLPNIAKDFAATDAVIHLWGHSWEIEERNLWRELDTVVATIADLAPAVSSVGNIATTLTCF